MYSCLYIQGSLNSLKIIIDALICVQYVTGLTTGAFAHHFDASLCIALGLLQLTLIGIGGGVGSAHRRHHGRAYNLLTHTFSFRGVSRVSFTQRSKSTQLSSATYGDRDKDIRVQISKPQSCDNCSVLEDYSHMMAEQKTLVKKLKQTSAQDKNSFS